VAIPHLRSLALIGVAAACAVAGVGARVLLFAPKLPAETTETEKPAEPHQKPGETEPSHDANHQADHSHGRPAHSKPQAVEPKNVAQAREHTTSSDEESHDAQPNPAKPRPMPMVGAKLTEKAEKRRTAEILRADEQFREGRIASALKLYGAAIEAHPTVLDPMVQFRCALCAESLGMLDEAAEKYQMLADATTAPAWKGFAQWGLSRVLFEQQKTELAHRITTELWLNQETSARLWRSELLHWHAHLLYRRAAGEANTRLLDDKTLAGCRIVVRPNLLLEIASRIHASETAAPFELPAEASVPITAGKDPEAMYAQYRSGGATISEAVNQFCDAAHWTVHWSTAADQLARTHRCRASVSRGSVACLLDALCEEARLMWTWDNQVLRITEANDGNDAGWKQYQLQSASRSAREAVELYRDARWSPYSRLAIAHIEWLSGMHAASRKSLDDLIANSPKGDLLAEAWFNLGKVQLHENAADKAIFAFQRTIDHCLGSGLEPIANLYLGRLLLESNEPKRAVVPLRRSLALAAPRDRGTAALTLGVAYILSEQPQNTAEILRSNQNWLDVDETRDAAAFSSCLAQVLGGHDPTRLKYDLRSLMTSISHVRSEQFFGRSGAVLVAMAYRELGLNGEAAEICQDAIAHMPPCALRMKLELMLVDEFLDRNDFDATEAQLRSICDSSNEEVRLIAFKRLCELLLQLDRRDEAEGEAMKWLRVCSTPDQQVAALHGLGRCLQKKGDYLNAALCFSGSMPQGVSPETPVTKNTPHP
jgi:predicted negative regulator of RcsB-dependent stress response